MLKLKIPSRRPRNVFSSTPVSSVGIETLENRRLLSAGGFCGGDRGGLGGFGGFGFGNQGSTIAFSQAPTAVQNGLDALATTDSLTAPTSTQAVYLKNSNGVETYTVDLTGTGTQAALTVDQNGNAITAATKSTTTWATLDGAGAGSNAASAGEISAIVTALNLTAPTSTTVVNVSTPSGGGAVTYSLVLTNGSGHGKTIISVDSTGNPVGNENIPFSAIPTAIQTGLNNGKPSGATALSGTSTQTVKVRTFDGVTLYTVVFTTTGTQTKVTVNAAGALTSLPTQTSTTFGALTTPQQTELQTLATADSVTGTISSTQNVAVFNEVNGTIIYSVTLDATGTSSHGTSYTYMLTVAIDAAGNPTVPPSENFGGGDFGGGFGGGGFEGAFHMLAFGGFGFGGRF